MSKGVRTIQVFVVRGELEEHDVHADCENQVHERKL
jgi:hypothetical protein